MGKSQCINAATTQRITMFDLAQSIENWKKQFYYRKGISPWDIYELSQHLEEEIALYQAKGLSDEKAFQLATEHLGNPEVIENEFSKLDRSKKNGISLSIIVKIFFNVVRQHKYTILLFWVLLSGIWIFFDVYNQIPMSHWPSWLKEVLRYLEYLKKYSLGVFTAFTFLWVYFKEIPKQYNNKSKKVVLWLYFGFWGFFEYLFMMTIFGLFYTGLAGSISFFSFVSAYHVFSIILPLLCISAIWLHSRFFLFSQFMVYCVSLSFYPSLFPDHRKIGSIDLIFESFDLTSMQPLLWFFYTLVIFILAVIGVQLIPHPFFYIYLAPLFMFRAILNTIFYHYLIIIVPEKN